MFLKLGRFYEWRKACRKAFRTMHSALFDRSRRTCLNTCLRIGFACGLAACSIAWAEEDPFKPPSENFFTLSTFASGERYLIRKDSFEPVGKGVLRYQVFGEPGRNGGEPRVSVNEVDCSTGRFRSPIASWSEADTSHSTMMPGPAFPMSLTNRTPLYRLLKNKCEEYAPVSW